MQGAPPPVPGPFPVLVPKQVRKRARPKEWLHRVALALAGMGNYTTWRLLHSAWGADEQEAAGVVYEHWMDAWVTNGQKLNVVTPESILTPDVRLRCVGLLRNPSPYLLLPTPTQPWHARVS